MTIVPEDYFAKSDLPEDPYGLALSDGLTERERTMWVQARGELLGFASALRRSDAGLTAAQISMAVALANRYVATAPGPRGEA